MSDLTINFSVRGACSYAWHKNSAKGDYKVVNLLKCLKTLIGAMFKEFQIKESEVVAIYNNNQKTIFGKEYQKQISSRKVEVQLNTINPDPDENKKNDVVSSVSRRISSNESDPDVKTKTEVQSSTMNSDPDENKKNDIDLSVRDHNSSSDSDLEIETQIISEKHLKELIVAKSFLPNIHYIVKGNVRCVLLQSLKELPDHLTIEGDLRLISCKFLKRLPKYLILTGTLYLYRCFAMNEFPENLTDFKKNVSLKECHSLIKLPKIMKVAGNLEVEHCKTLTIPPEEIHVDGNATFSCCPKLTMLPFKIYVEGELTTFISVSESDNVIVKGRIIVSDWSFSTGYTDPKRRRNNVIAKDRIIVYAKPSVDESLEKCRLAAFGTERLV